MDGCPKFAPAYLGRKRPADPDFLYAALDTATCAAFDKESRMNFANANQLHRKSGKRPSTALSRWTRKLLAFFCQTHLGEIDREKQARHIRYMYGNHPAHLTTFIAGTSPGGHKSTRSPRRLQALAGGSLCQAF